MVIEEKLINERKGRGKEIGKRRERKRREEGRKGRRQIVREQEEERENEKMKSELVGNSDDIRSKCYEDNRKILS